MTLLGENDGFFEVEYTKGGTGVFGMERQSTRGNWCRARRVIAEKLAEVESFVLEFWDSQIEA